MAYGHALVSGGAGFIGSHVVDRLLADGYHVGVLDNLATGCLSNLAETIDHIEFHQGDLRSLDDVRKAVEGCELVVHLGALGSVPRSLVDPLTTHDVNATGTLNMLLAARDAGCRRLLFSSSSSVFGSNPELPKREGMLGLPLSPYAATKSIAEDYCRQFSQHFDLEAVAVRFFNVFGPRQAADHVYAAVIPKFINAALQGQPAEIHGNGEQSRDFTYVSNVVDGLLLLAAADLPADKTFHLACGTSISLLKVLDLIESTLGHPVPRRHVGSRPGDIRDSLADITRIRDLTGYEPAVNVTQGIAHTIEWFRAESAGSVKGSA